MKSETRGERNVMISTSPLVSVIVPCYNRADLIGRAIESVQGQTFRDWELIVVDDGSSDNLAESLQVYADDARIRLVCHPHNRGEPAARNAGIVAALGHFVAFLDSDDTWLPKKLDRQIAAVMAMPDPDRVLCVTQTLVILSDRRWIIRPQRGPAPGRSFGEFLYNDGGFTSFNSFFLARSLARQFPFREHLRNGVDHLFFLEVGASGAAYVLVQEPLDVYHNDVRPDRASLSDDLAKVRSFFQQFSDQAASFVPPHVIVAAEARFLSGPLWKTAPAASLKLLLRARRSGALSARQVAMLFCRNAMPRRAYDAVRHWLSAVQQGIAIKRFECGEAERGVHRVR
jgi:glycosyltransferase involved in cell wall biosynthesis